MTDDHLLMDRIGQRLRRLNSKMVQLREEWYGLSDADRYERFAQIQAEYTNAITPAAFPETWRMAAEANGVVILPARICLAVRRWLRKMWRRHV